MLDIIAAYESGFADSLVTASKDKGRKLTSWEVDALFKVRALATAGWGVVAGSRIRRKYPIAPGRLSVAHHTTSTSFVDMSLAPSPQSLVGSIFQCHLEFVQFRADQIGDRKVLVLASIRSDLNH